MKLSFDNMSEKEIRSTMLLWLNDYKPLLLHVFNVVIETGDESIHQRSGDTRREVRKGNVYVVCLKSPDVYSAVKKSMIYKNRITVFVNDTMVAFLEWSSENVYGSDSFVRHGDWRSAIESVLRDGMKKLEAKRIADESESRNALLERLHASEDL